MIPSAPQQQPPQNRHRSLSLSSGGEISARTEEIQSALEVQVRRLFERFGGGALWGRSSNNESTGREAPAAAESSENDDDEDDGESIHHPGHHHLRGGGKTTTGSKKWSQKLCSPFRDLRGLVHTALLATMNAAVAIFGVGVGVGLILGDSFRGAARADDMEDYVMEEEMDQVQRRRGTGRDGGGRNEGQGGQAGRARHGDDLSGAGRPSLSNLPAQ